MSGKIGIQLLLVCGSTVVALQIDRRLLPLVLRRERPLLAHLSGSELRYTAVVTAAMLVCWAALPAVMLIEEIQHRGLLVNVAVVAVGCLLLVVAMMCALTPLQLLLRWRMGRPAVATSHADQRGGLRPAFERASPARGQRGDARTMPAHLHWLRSAEPPSRTGSARRTRHAWAVDSEAEADAEQPSGTTLTEAMAACRPVIAGLLVISLVINILMLTGPLYMLQVYDRVLTSRSRETLTLLTLLLVGLFLVLGLLELIRARVLARLSLRLDRLLGPDLIARAIAPASTATPGAAPSLLRDLELVRNFVSGPLPPALLDLPWAPFYCALVFLLHPLLGLVTLVGAAVLTGLSVISQLVTRRRLAASAEETARCHGLVEAGRESAEAMQAMGMARAQRSRWLAAHRAALSRQAEAGDTASAFATAIRIGRLLLQSLILATGAWLALNDLVSAGAMIAASVITARALAPVEQLISQWRSLVAARAALDRCSIALAKPNLSQQRLTLPEPSGTLTVAHLYVAAPGRTEPVIKGLNFQLEPGDAMAVIGPSASGKSTLARALVGVWPLRHGDIRLDGATLSQWDPEALGRHIGYLPQDISLLEGSIAENIARLAADPDPAQVIAAARAAGVHEMILRLDQGYATLVGPRGATLSGGQRQRIALARALYGNPALVVMDEPNANLDGDGEAALVAAINAQRRAGRTVVVMAHRRTVLTACNRVLLLKDGRQAAFGTPQDVLGPPQRAAMARKPTETTHASIAAVRPIAAGP